MEIKMESANKEFEELVAKKVMESNVKTAKRIIGFRKWYLIAEVLLGLIGYGIIIYQFNIWVAIALYIILWGSNLGVIRCVHKEHDNFWKEIWKW